MKHDAQRNPFGIPANPEQKETRVLAGSAHAEPFMSVSLVFPYNYADWVACNGGMMVRFFVFFLLVVFLGSTVVLAQTTDEGSSPNDPITNEDANACFEGGTMEGKCIVEWSWTCGWYLIRFEYGIFQREVIPDGCAGLLPPEPIISASEPVPAPTPPVVTPTCVLAWNPNFYVDFSGSNFVGSGNYWSDPDCTLNNGNLSRKWVHSPSGQAAATDICITNLGPGYTAIPADSPTVFECVV